MRQLIMLIAVFVLTSACGTVSHYGARPDFSKISMGMSQAEVIETMGKPDDMSAQAGTVYLRYTWAPWYDHSGADGNAEDYYVRLIDNKVESFGKVGDFDSTKNPEQTINVNVNKSDQD